MATNDTNPFATATEEKPLTGVTPAQLGDPTLRDLIKQDLLSRATAGTMMLPNYEEQQAKEIALAREGITSLGEAERLKALPLLEESYQRRGMLSSGGATKKMFETTEEIRLREQSQLADVQREVLARYGGYREAGLQRQSTERIATEGNIYAGAANLTQAEANIEIANLNARTDLSAADKQVEIARIQAYVETGAQSTERDVANIRATADKQIAQVQANTTMSAADKQVEIARIQASSDRQIATIQQGTAMGVAKIQAASNTDVATIQTTSDERVASIQQDTSLTLGQQNMRIESERRLTEVKIANINEAVTRYGVDIGKQVAAERNASEERIESIRQDTTLTVSTREMRIAAERNATDIAVANITGETAKAVEATRTAAGISVANIQALSSKYAVDANQTVAMSELAERTREFDLTTEQGKKEFWANYDLAIKNAGTDEEYKKALIAQAKDDLYEKARQFNVTTTEGTTEFWANYDLAREKFGKDVEYQNKMYNLAYDQFTETIRQYNITTTQGTTEFWAMYDIQMKTANADAAYKEGLTNLARDQFNEGIRQWSIVTTEQTTEFWEQMKLANQKFGLDKSMQEAQYKLAVDQFLRQQKEWNITTTEDTKRFWANYQTSRDQLQLSKDTQSFAEHIQTKTYALYEAQFRDEVRKFDLTRSDQISQVADKLNWDKTQFWATDQLTRDTQRDVLLEQARQFTITTANDMTKYLGTMRTTMDQFNITTQDQRNYAAATLRLQAEQVADSDVANWTNGMVGILTSPIMESVETEDLVPLLDELFQKMDSFLVEPVVDLAFSTEGKQLDVTGFVADMEKLIKKDTTSTAKIAVSREVQKAEADLNAAKKALSDYTYSGTDQSKAPAMVNLLRGNVTTALNKLNALKPVYTETPEDIEKRKADIRANLTAEYNKKQGA